ncbi:hypothetical protein CQ13_10085 [Bradyrhizobium retamae]|uniref:Uncharacterized protein n=1 Tax=Bradyrhizobium retamae TaxID=1300035 RepID=A0A0R3MKU3_9BRAD|nr:hypothetical protein CQ13_10085 [Bradyrhizobium retamae]
MKKRRQPAFARGRKLWPKLKVLTKLAPPISTQILGKITRIADCIRRAGLLCELHAKTGRQCTLWKEGRAIRIGIGLPAGVNRSGMGGSGLEPAQVKIWTKQPG